MVRRSFLQDAGLTPKQEDAVYVLLLTSIVLVLAYECARQTRDAFDIRSEIHSAQNFNLSLYLRCHQWRSASLLGNLMVGCDAMTNVNYTALQPYIWNADLNRELECTTVSQERRYKGWLPKECWRGRLGTFNNYADISHTTAGHYLDCLRKNVPGWPNVGNIPHIRLCDPIIPATYDILLDRYKAKAGQSTVDVYRLK